MPRTPIHPGEHLAEQLEALGMSAAAFARLLCIPRHRVREITYNNVRRFVFGEEFVDYLTAV